MTYMESLFNSFKTALVDLFERTAYSDMNASNYVARLKQIIWDWNGAFPSDTYQKVQYVGATGTQFILFDSLAVDTESELEKYTYEIDCCVDSSIGTGTKIIAGFGSDGGHWLGYNSGVGNMALGTSSGCYFPNGDPTEHTKYNYSVENGVGKVARQDGVVITRESSAFSKPTRFCLFTASYQTSGGVIDGNSVFAFSGKIYEFKMSYDGTLIMNLVPCYRKSDGVIGFYDMTGQEFYVNTGTGTFTKGGDI